MVKKSRHSTQPALGEPAPGVPKALTKQEFGRRLHRMMIDAGMNQSELARAANIGRYSVSTYINGKTFPTPQSLAALADALNVSVTDILPNALMMAIDEEHPEFEIKAAAGHPDQAWLRINRAVSFSTAAKIAMLINEEDKAE